MNWPNPLSARVLAANLFLAGGALGFAFAGVHVFLNRNTYPPTVAFFTGVAAAMALAGLGFGLFSAIETKLKVALALFSTVAALYLAELGSGILSRRLDREVVARSLGVEFDGRTQLEVVRDLRVGEPEAYPLVSPEEFLPAGISSRTGKPLLPLSGISLVTTVWCNEGGRFFIYQSDRHGFNNPPGAWAESPQILLIGDSFVHGACAEAGEDIGNQLRAQGHSVLNLGMGGGGPLLELAILREYAQARNPKFVFWVYYEGNDLLNLRTEMESAILQRYLEQPDFAQDLLHRRDELDAILRDYFERRFENEPTGRDLSALSVRAGLFLKLTNLRLRLSMLRTEVPPGALDTLKRVLGQAKELLAQRGGELVFVYLPAYSREASATTELYQRARVLSLVRALRIPLLDFHETVSRSDEPTKFFPLGLNGHYNGYGYRLLAEELGRFVALSAPSGDGDRGIREPGI